MIKKEKIFELKIQEDDEVSGIDSISLVDEPAIEVNWVAFKKEKEHEFHIPDGEDDIYLEKLLSKSQDEQELFNQGWVVDKITIIGKEGFYSTDPNAPSEEDEKEYNVRYKYILNPSISQSPIIQTTRDFCRTLINQNRVWRIEDMDATRNDFGDSALVWRGGYNCRHVWARIEYKKDVTIINKASINKGKIDPQAPVDTRVLGMEQPSTVTGPTLANPSTSTIKNLGLSKEGFMKVSMDYDQTLSTDRGKELAKKMLKEGQDVSIITRRQSDQMDAVYATAKELGIPRDKVHSTDGKLKWETIKKLGIEKHIDNNEKELQAINDNVPGVKTEKFDYDVSTLPPYVDQLPKKKKKDFEYLLPKEDMSKQHFATDTEKHIVLGPAMIPDQKIFRKDAQGNPYYVYFSPDTIKMIAEKYMRNKYTDNNDTMHDGKAVKDIHVLESWIKEDNQDKSNKYGFESLPVGTWFVSMKVNNPKVWEDVKEGKLNGFSVSGYFEEVAQFSKEEMFLYKVAEILKNIKD
jgi:hypothetical protein